jgi:hypothetical protein
VKLERGGIDSGENNETKQRGKQNLRPLGRIAEAISATAPDGTSQTLEELGIEMEHGESNYSIRESTVGGGWG